MLSLAKHSAMAALLGLGGGLGLDGQAAAEELLEEEVVEAEDELTKCAESEDWGLITLLPEWGSPLTGELPEVKPSSAELE